MSKTGPGVWLLLSLCLPAGCAPEPELEPIFALAERFPGAELRYEPARIDFEAGEDAGVLLEGWSWSERSSDGSEYRWSNRPVSSIVFFLPRPRDIELAFRCQPFSSAKDGPQEIVVVLNGREVETVRLGAGWTETRLLLPSTAALPGDNRLELRYAWTVTPAEQGNSKERRGLAVAWDWLAFSEAEAKPATADAGSGLVLLPAGSRVDYYFEAPPGSRLTVPAVDLRGEVLLAITAAWDSAGGEETASLAELVESGRDLDFRLPASDGPIRLRLETLRGAPGSPASFDSLGPSAGDSLGPSAGFAALRRPRVLAPVTSPDSAAGAPGMERSPEPPEPAGPEAPRPNILVYVIDTLRAGQLGAYGYSRPVSPWIDALSTEGVLFENAQAQSSWTKPSAASILSGLLPWRHGAAGEASRLAAEAPNLTEALKAEGYRTGAASANGYVSAVYGFARAFDLFALAPGVRSRSRKVHALALDWLGTLEGEAPYFLYVQPIDPHAPYAPPEDLRRRFAPDVTDPEAGSLRRVKGLLSGAEPSSAETAADLLALYDAEVADNDREFESFLNAVRELGRLENTLLIVTADHGEEFYEHGGWTHRLSLHTEVLDVPLIVRFPGGEHAGTRIATPVQHADILPTILDVLGLPELQGVDGESLLPLIEPGNRAERQRPVVSHLAIAHGPFFSVIQDGWKLITAQVAGRSVPPQLFDRRRDRAESENLAAAFPVRVGYLTSLIRLELARGAPEAEDEPVELDSETRRALEALGYLN